MYTLVAVVLLAVGAVQAQMNQTCCPPSFTALGFHGLLGFEFDYYYDHTTGDRLTVDLHGDVAVLEESLSGRIYTRLLSDNSCTYTEMALLKNSSNCVTDHMVFYGAVVLDGVTYYEWHVHVGDIEETAFVDDACLTKILYTSLNHTPFTSFVLFNPVANANVSAITRFDKTGCLLA